MDHNELKWGRLHQFMLKRFGKNFCLGAIGFFACQIDAFKNNGEKITGVYYDNER